MSRPRFSIVLPTKNRSFLVGHAIQSALTQSCSDLELIVADNDDGDATRQTVERFRDPRLRYLRTGGLNMNDNWERAAEAASGEYLVMIEDKQMLRRNALARLEDCVAQHQPEVIRWLWDDFEDTERPPRVRRLTGDETVAMVPSDVLLDGFLNDPTVSYQRALPLPQLSCLRRTVLDRIKAGPFRRLFPPVSLDVMTGTLLLNEVEAVCQINAPLVLFTSNFHGNGASIARKGTTGQTFLRQLPGGVGATYDLVPIKCLNTANSIYNDFLHVQAAVGGRLLRHQLNYVKYFTEAYAWMIQPAFYGVDMTAELHEWERALQTQSPAIQNDVRASLHARRLRMPTPFKIARQRAARALRLRQMLRWIKHLYRGRLLHNPEWRFTDPVAYHEWACAQAERASSLPSITSD